MPRLLRKAADRRGGLMGLLLPRPPTDRGLCGYAIGPPALAGNWARLPLYGLSNEILENISGEVALDCALGLVIAIGGGRSVSELSSSDSESGLSTRLNTFSSPYASAIFSAMYELWVSSKAGTSVIVLEPADSKSSSSSSGSSVNRLVITLCRGNTRRVKKKSETFTRPIYKPHHQNPLMHINTNWVFLT